MATPKDVSIQVRDLIYNLTFEQSLDQIGGWVRNQVQDQVSNEVRNRVHWVVVIPVALAINNKTR